MARHPKPIELHIAQGTFRPDRHGPRPDEDETIAPPTKPADLRGDAGKFWDRIIVVLAGVARDRDEAELAELCRWWARAQKFGRALDRSKPGSMESLRLQRQASDASQRFDQFAKRFGLTPADRVVLRAEQVGPVRAKVATRPRTKLDTKGPPK